MEETEFVSRVKQIGGHAYVVGGWVRDQQMGALGRDKDYVVTGVTENAFNAVFPGAFKTGRFPVYLLEIARSTCDVSLARSETKTGRGYRGFDAAPSPHVTIERDLERRDTTVNAMAVDLETGALVDPYGGLEDLRNGVIRAVSERFADDPVRALRAARQAAQFNFRIEPGTIRLMAACRDELADEPAERLANELRLAMSCHKPSVFFVCLDAAGLQDAVYPAIPSPSGEDRGAFCRRMDALDRAAALTERPEIRFAALAFGTAPQWSHLARKLPRIWRSCALFAESLHERAFETDDPDAIRDLAERLANHPIGLDGFGAVILSVCGQLPPLLERAHEIEGAIQSVKASDAPDGLRGPRLGAWLRDRRNRAIAEIMDGPASQPA